MSMRHGFIGHPLLPRELFDMVVDNVDDRETLKTLSLVSRAWWPRCKERLFRQIELVWPDYHKTLKHLDSDTLNIYKSVRHVIFRCSDKAAVPTVLDDAESDSSAETDEKESECGSDDDFSGSQPMLKLSTDDLLPLSTFLHKLIHVEELTIIALGCGPFPSHWNSTVKLLRLEHVAFSRLASAVSFVAGFHKLESLSVDSIRWEDDDGPECFETADNMLHDIQPLSSLHALSIRATHGSTDMLCRIMPAEKVAEPPIQTIAVECLNTFEVPVWQDILERTGDHLHDLDMRLSWQWDLPVSAGGERESLSLHANGMLRSLTYHFDEEETTDNNAQSFLRVLSTITSVHIEEVFVADIFHQWKEEDAALWDKLRLINLEDKLEHHTHFSRLRRLKFGFNVEGVESTRHEEVKDKIITALRNRLPKAIARGVEVVADVSIDEADQP